jgi:hypothetical protein
MRGFFRSIHPAGEHVKSNIFVPTLGALMACLCALCDELPDPGLQEAAEEAENVWPQKAPAVAKAMARQAKRTIKRLGFIEPCHGR